MNVNSWRKKNTLLEIQLRQDNHEGATKWQFINGKVKNNVLLYTKSTRYLHLMPGNELYCVFNMSQFPG